jgi:hypothetical protein
MNGKAIIIILLIFLSLLLVYIYSPEHKVSKSKVSVVTVDYDKVSNEYEYSILLSSAGHGDPSTNNFSNVSLIFASKNGSTIARKNGVNIPVKYGKVWVNMSGVPGVSPSKYIIVHSCDFWDGEYQVFEVRHKVWHESSQTYRPFDARNLNSYPIKLTC